MHPALWISKTGLDAKQRDISVISNNLANASTVGFKKIYEKHNVFLKIFAIGLF